MNLAIFDVDGTLLDNLAGEDACYVAALRQGLRLTELDADWAAYEHVSDEGIAQEAYCRAFGSNPSPALLAQTIDYFLMLLADAHACEPLTPIAGAARLLAVLPAHGWIPALATGAWNRAARFKLAAAGLSFKHLALATAEDGPARLNIVRAAWTRAATQCAATSVSPTPFERVVLIGDGVWDLATAQTLELPFVGRALGVGAEELRARGAVSLLANFMHVDAVLAALETATVPGAVTR